MGEQRVLEEAQAELSKRMKALADPAALAMKSTRFILRQRWWAWMSISHNIFDIQGVCYLAWTPLLYLESSWTELLPLVLSQSHPLPSILLRTEYKSWEKNWRRLLQTCCSSKTSWWNWRKLGNWRKGDWNVFAELQLDWKQLTKR